MENLTINDIIVLLVSLSAGGTALMFLTQPIRKIFSEVKRLNFAVFGEDRRGNILATKEDMNKVSDAISKLADATNLMYKSVIMIIEALPESDKLEQMKERLNEHNVIV